MRSLTHAEMDALLGCGSGRPVPTDSALAAAIDSCEARGCLRKVPRAPGSPYYSRTELTTLGRLALRVSLPGGAS